MRHGFLRTLGMLTAFLAVSIMPAWGSELESSLDRFFAHGIHHQGANAELIKVTRWPNTQQAVRWKMPNINHHPSHFSLIAEQGEGLHQRRWYVPVQVHWWANVATARKNLPRRTLIQTSMIQIEKADVANHIGNWWQTPAELQGMRVMRTLQAHQAIFSYAVTQPPLIKRGDYVTIIAGNSNFSVHAEGQAMKSASLGERVLVQNMRSKERIQAIVIDANTVRVHI